MNPALVLIEYASWHYGDGVREYLLAWKNLHWFFYHFFSVPVLFATLFQPFHRMRESYKRGFDPEAFFESAFGNAMIRIVGFVARSVLLFVALVFNAFLFICGIIMFFGFLSAPVLIPFIFAVAFSLIFS